MRVRWLLGIVIIWARFLRFVPVCCDHGFNTDFVSRLSVLVGSVLQSRLATSLPVLGTGELGLQIDPYF